MELAYSEGRVLLTEDKDFGWLAFAARMPSAGVILIRFPSYSRHSLSAGIISLVNEFEDKLNGAFAVLLPGSVRISYPGQKR